MIAIESNPQFLDIPNNRYHAATDWVSKSMLSAFADCPAKFAHLYLDGGKREETAALRIGSAVHLYAFEPEKWDAGYYVMPEGIKRDARHKAFQEQMAAAGDRTILKPEEFEQVEGMANSLIRNQKAVALLRGLKVIEHSVFWRDEEHGVNLRCRPDVVRLDTRMIINLKTARSARPESFFRSAFDLHYDLSVAMECRGFEAVSGEKTTEYIFLVIETEAPYVVEAYNCFEPIPDQPMTYRDLGEYRLRNYLQRFAECRAANRWPSYTENITPMQAPSWQLRRLEDM